jgi:serine/threonine protein kinase
MQLEKIGDYQLVKNPKLGSGATGEVFYGQNMKNNYKVAAKQIDTTKINASLAKQIENEIKNLTKLNSPFIVKLYDYFKCGNYLYLFLEYCEDGDLKSYMDSKKGSGLC